MRVALLTLSMLVIACSSEPAPARPAPPSPAPTHAAPPPPQAAPLPPGPAPSAPVVALAAGEPPARGCVQVEERVIAPGAKRVLLASDRGALAALVVGGDERTLSLSRGASLSSLAETARTELEARASRLTLAGGDALRLALVDERGRVLLVALTARAFEAPRLLAEGADRRFAPAYAARDGAELVAFTRSVNDAMHTFLARVVGARVALDDLTPEGHGAAAPTFVLGVDGPRLLAIDARAGVSPLLELALGRGAQAIVRTPVSQPFAPPLLAAAALPGTDEVVVAYTAIGRLAATAVGRVSLTRAGEPSALLPSRGYGELALSVVRGPARLAFALESPRAEAADAPRALEVKLLDATGEGPGLTLAAEGASARSPSLALGPGGTLWLGFVREQNGVISTLRCDL